MDERHDHGFSDSRRLVIAMESIARSLRTLTEGEIGRLARQVNRSTDKLEKAVKDNTPKKQ